MFHRPTAARRRTRLGAGLVAAGVVAGLALTATPAHADDPAPSPPSPSGEFQPRAGVPSTYVYGSKSVTSTKDKNLRVSLGASKSSESGLSVSLSQQREMHGWNFDMPARHLVVDSTGAGSLRTTAANPYGQISLKIVPKESWKVTKCEGKVVSKTRPVTLKGTFVFDSKSAWGKVGKKDDFSMPGTVSVYTGASNENCVGGGNPCPTFGGGWSNFGGNVFLSGSWRNGATTGTISGYRSVKLPEPAGAYRFDLGSAEVVAPELVSNPDGSAVLKVKTGKPGAKGTATLTAPSKFSSDGTCTGGVTYTTSSWWGAQYANGSTPLQVVMSVFGNLKLPNAANTASFNRVVKTS